MFKNVHDQLVYEVAQQTGFEKDTFSFKYLIDLIFRPRNKVYYNKLIKKLKDILQN